MNREEHKKLLESCELNLSDFALFLSVMKNKEAYECTLSIILGEEDLELEEVKVEQVILNKDGRRAIRLDAWARDSQARIFNTEMQNDTESDDVRRRSRFYQGLMDSPILKSGKSTRYKNLPSTIIIFITNEDIFGRDLARYTFEEQCLEVPGMLLGDGTRKIFLNMSSKNGAPELVSLLQYMKETRLDNPKVSVQDHRIKRLDEIVQEVKQSEEWEDASMSIYGVGLEKGRQLGEETGKQIGLEEGRQYTLVELVCKKLRKGKNPQQIAEELEEELERIESICQAAIPFAPDYDVKKVFNLMYANISEK